MAPRVSRALGGFGALRKALLAHTGKSKQWLSSEVARRTRRAAMSVPVAQAVVAHDSGIRVSKYLSGGDFAEVQQAIRDLTAGGGAGLGAGPATANGRRAVSRVKLAPSPGRSISFKGAKISIVDPFLPSVKIEEARAMADVYPMLYVLENSIREVLRRVMAAQYGDDWWRTQMTRGKVAGVATRVADRMTSERRNSWHQRRGAYEIDYTDFGDLLTIAESKPELFFPVLLGEQEWFRQFFREVVPSRNVVSHMNPLSDLNADSVSVKLKQWEEHLKNQRADIQAAMTPA